MGRFLDDATRRCKNYASSRQASSRSRESVRPISKMKCDSCSGFRRCHAASGTRPVLVLSDPTRSGRFCSGISLAFFCRETFHSDLLRLSYGEERMPNQTKQTTFKQLLVEEIRDLYDAER